MVDVRICLWDMTLQRRCSAMLGATAVGTVTIRSGEAQEGSSSEDQSSLHLDAAQMKHLRMRIIPEPC